MLYFNLMDESIEGFRFLEFVGLCNQGNFKYGLLFHFWSVQREKYGMLYVKFMDEDRERECV